MRKSCTAPPKHSHHRGDPRALDRSRSLRKRPSIARLRSVVGWYSGLFHPGSSRDGYVGLYLWRCCGAFSESIARKCREYLKATRTIVPSPAQYLRSLGFLPYHMDGRVIGMGHIWWSPRSRERSSAGDILHANAFEAKAKACDSGELVGGDIGHPENVQTPSPHIAKVGVLCVAELF